MSFGYSIGDFFAGANLSYRLVKALSSTQGPYIEYQEAIAELGCLQQTFLQVGRMTTNPNLSAATVNAASHIVLSSMSLIGDFFERTKSYRERFRQSGSRSAVSDSWQKMGWVLFKKEELMALTNALHVKLSSISVLLSTAKFNERMPSLVAQYQVSDPVNPSPRQPSYTHLDGDSDDATLIEEPLQANHTLRDTPENETRSELEARLTRLERMTGELRTTDGTRPIEVPFQPDENGLAIDPHVDNGGSIPFHSPDLESDVTPQEEAGLFTRFEMFLKAQRKLEVHDANMVADLEALIAKHTPLKAKHTPLPQDPRKPIRFKDAMGRKFSFPFHLAGTWAGMEELIRQSFLHVQVIGPHVADGHYDLIGPNGEIILPQMWETMIEPDWQITMHMWPMPEPKSVPPGDSPWSGGPPPPPVTAMPSVEKSNDRKKWSVRGWVARKTSKIMERDKSESGSDSDACSTSLSLFDD